MIITTTIKITINKTNYKYYQKFGYNLNDNVEIPIEQLSKGSDKKILVKCDVCGNEKIITFYNYNKNIKKYNFYSCSHKCANEKRKLTNIEIYGYENVFQNKYIIEKSKHTKLEKYGNENYVNVDKMQNTDIKKYGCHHLKSEDVKNKIKETKIKNGSFFLNDLIKNKMKKTNLKKFSAEYPAKSDDVKLKMKKTNLKKYNSENYMTSDVYKEKQLKKSIKKYSCEIISFDKSVYTIKCDKCENIFDIKISNLIQRYKYKIPYCIICNPFNDSVSNQEKDLQIFIKENYNKEIQLNKRNIIPPYELDIFLPDLKLAFEFNGIYWHNEKEKENNYHLIKTELSENINIHLIHIFQDDWGFKQKIVKSRILNLLGKTPNKIYGRKCNIKEINDNKLVRCFLENNHLQGFVGSQIKLGLFYNDELISLMTFGSKRKFMKQSNIDGVYEMLRFCSKLNTSVIGGAEKLFKYFIKNYNPKEVISYADRSWSMGKLYQNLGFTFVNKTPPNYYYVMNGTRKHRFGFRKNILIKQGFDSNKTEHEIMLERGLYRIYDSGSLKYVFILLV